jgi:hypothetical protein
VNGINHNGENVVTTILNLIHFFNIQNCKNWVQKRTSYVIFVKRCLKFSTARKMKFSIFVTSHIRMGWIMSSYEDKYLILRKKIKIKKKKKFYSKNKRVVVLIHNSTTTYPIDTKFVVPRALFVFTFSVKMTQRSSTNCIHNRKTKH